MIHQSEFRHDILEGFDIGHCSYIETASGINHMYFMLGTDTKPINKGMRCKDFLQEVFLIKRFPKCHTSNNIYGFKLRGVRTATKLFLKWPNKNMSEYTDNINRCIMYINTAYNINISACVKREYIELNMPFNWFTDKINPVEASAICSMLRSCLIWKYNTYKDMLKNIDDVEDEYEFKGVFPDKDWSAKSKFQLEFLGNLKAQKVLGRWDFCSKSVKDMSCSMYHNNSGWVSCANFNRDSKMKKEALDLLEKMSPSTLVSDQCILIDEKTGKLLYPKLIRNSNELVRAIRKLDTSKGSKTLKLVFNNSMSHTRTNRLAHCILKTSDGWYDWNCLATMHYSIIKLNMAGRNCNKNGLIKDCKERYELCRLRRVLNALSYESVFNFEYLSGITSPTSDSREEFKQRVMSEVKHKKTIKILDKMDLLDKVYDIVRTN